MTTAVVDIEALLFVADLLDPDDLVDRLQLTSTDIVLAFSQRLIEKEEEFAQELERYEHGQFERSNRSIND